MTVIIKIKLSNTGNNPNILLPDDKTVQRDQQEFTMTSFVHLDYSTEHPGVARVESALGAARQLGHGFSGTRGLATLLLSAVVAAIMVVAYQIMDSVAEGHLLVGWLAIWGVAFVALAVFASTARKTALRLKAGLDGWSRTMAEARADERLWAMAKADARVMADLQTARTRDEALASPLPAAPAATVMVAERTLQASHTMLRAYQRNYI
jgi:hypothetical protein